MNNITVDAGGGSYPIYIRQGLDELAKAAQDAGFSGRKLCLVTDSNTRRLYADAVKKAVEGCFSGVFIYEFEAGERSKNLDTISGIYEFLLENRFDRKDAVAGLGGGVCGDMAGFAAASYMRGIGFIQLPTTLLAQVDSSVGGKVGVDFNGVKNIVGAFYQPAFVYIDTDSLKTLPKREIAAGMAEVIKYGMIVSRKFYDYVWENREALLACDEAVFAEIIARCCSYKAEVVAKDEKEANIRAILNYGHTIGHAVESLKEFELIHGECVGIGMAAAMHISYKRGDITSEVAEALEALLKYFGIPVRASGLAAQAVYERMLMDKKASGGRIRFVLLEKIGEACVTEDISEAELMDAIEYILS